MTFTPQANIISAMTNELLSNVTTQSDHGYITGQYVRIFVPIQYGMFIPYTQTIINVTGTNTFQTQIDTSLLETFVTPSSYPPLAFTSAQCVPITGLEENIA